MNGYPLYLLIVLVLAACAGASPNCPVKRTWTRDEQAEIAKERNILADSEAKPLFDAQGHQVHFLIAPAVFQDWERTRKATP